MNSPATPQVNTLRNLCMILALCVALGCAGHLHNRGYLAPDDVRKWEGIPCTYPLLVGVYQAMQRGTATPGQVMYYYRCKARPSKQGIRPREMNEPGG